MARDDEGVRGRAHQIGGDAGSPPRAPGGGNGHRDIPAAWSGRRRRQTNHRCRRCRAGERIHQPFFACSTVAAVMVTSVSTSEVPTEVWVGTRSIGGIQRRHQDEAAADAQHRAQEADDRPSTTTGIAETPCASAGSASSAAAMNQEQVPGRRLRLPAAPRCGRWRARFRSASSAPMAPSSAV